MALNEDLVASARVILAAKKVVEADFIKAGARGVGRDVATDGDTGALGAVHEHRGVPADPRAVAALDVFVAGKLGLVLGRDGVDVVGGGNHRHTQVQLFAAFE